MTTVRNVTEVALSGHAQAEPWRILLEASGVQPRLTDGRVDVVLTACQGRFWGRTFCEVSLCIALPSRADGTPVLHMAGAFNSVRFFAWAERTFFRTPYARGSISLAGGASPRFTAPAVSAQAGAGSTPWTPGDDDWCGLLHLPRRAGDRPARGRYFVARLRGASLGRAFEPAHDRIALLVPASAPAWAALASCAFEPAAWRVRAAGVHARSRTFLGDPWQGGAASARPLRDA